MSTLAAVARRSSLLSLASLLSLLAAPACDPSASSGTRPITQPPSAAHAAANASSAAPSTTPDPPLVAPTPPAPKTDVEKLGDATLSLADDLLARVDANGNVVFAPASISAALAMTYAGARGATADEMRKTLHFDALAKAGDDAALHGAWNQLLANWSAQSEKEPRLEVANRLFGQRGFAFLPAFLDLTRDRYGAPLEAVDFAATEAARLRINAWVSERTAKAIPSLIAPGVLSRDSRLALVNAVHVKGAGEQPFVPEATRPAAFETASGASVQVPTMQGSIDTRFVDGKDAQIVALPFASAGARKLEVDVVLPAQGAKPSLRAWTQAIDAASYAEVMLSLPRFKIGSSFELSSTLAAMGMPRAFGGAADFSGMTGKTDLAISAVVHQAVLDVNESGAEIAAATAVVMTEKGMPQYVKMRVDRPFYVMIRDRQSGAVLFVAHVRDPKAGA